MGGRWVEHIARPDPDDPSTMICTGETIIHDDRNLEEAQRDALQNLKHEYDQRVAAGRNYAGKNFQIDGASLQAINAAATRAFLGNGWPADFGWIGSDNSVLPIVTGKDMIAFANDLSSYASALVLVNRAKKDAIAALPDRDSCDAFDVTTGWPDNP